MLHKFLISVFSYKEAYPLATIFFNDKTIG